MLAVLQQYRHYRPSLDGYPWLIHPVLANTRHTWLSFHTHSRREWSQNYLKSLVFPLFFHLHHFVFCQDVPTMQCNISPSSWDNWCMLIGQLLISTQTLLTLILVCRKIIICSQIFLTLIKNLSKKKHKKYATPKCFNYIPYNPSP